MTRAEALELIDLILPNYPQIWDRDLEAIADLWVEAMPDLSYADAKTALLKAVQHCRFWPTIADIREHAPEPPAPPHRPAFREPSLPLPGSPVYED